MFAIHRKPVTSFLNICALAMLAATTAIAAPPESTVSVRFRDSATGYAIRPEASTRSDLADAVEKRFSSKQISSAGRAAFTLERGHHTITAISPQHRPM